MEYLFAMGRTKNVAGYGQTSPMFKQSVASMCDFHISFVWSHIYTISCFE